MPFNSIEPLESRTLLAAGVIDSSYHPALDHKNTPFSILEIVRVQPDGKSIHYAPLKRRQPRLILNHFHKKPDALGRRNLF